MASVTICGFKTNKQAEEFIKWYEGAGEQFFYEHLDIKGMSASNGCLVDVTHKGNSGSYYHEDSGINNNHLFYVYLK